jgi:hypothetical protein
VFQISVLRQMAITIMLPLALMVGISCRDFAATELPIVTLVGIALATMHPIMTDFRDEYAGDRRCFVVSQTESSA